MPDLSPYSSLCLQQDNVPLRENSPESWGGNALILPHRHRSVGGGGIKRLWLHFNAPQKKSVLLAHLCNAPAPRLLELSHAAMAQADLAGRTDHCLLLSRLRTFGIIHSKDQENPACAGGEWHLREVFVKGTPQQPHAACAAVLLSQQYFKIGLKSVLLTPSTGSLQFFFPPCFLQSFARQAAK